jgi:hypothetical protein
MKANDPARALNPLPGRLFSTAQTGGALIRAPYVLNPSRLGPLQTKKGFANVGSTKTAPAVNANWGIERRIRLSRDLAVTLTIGPAHACAQWHPAMPDRLSPTQWRRYRAGRDRLVAQVAARMGGGRAIVLEQRADGVLEGRVVDAEP